MADASHGCPTGHASWRAARRAPPLVIGPYYDKSLLANTRERPIYAGEVAILHTRANYHQKPAKNALQSEPDLVDFPATGTSENAPTGKRVCTCGKAYFPALCATVG